MHIIANVSLSTAVVGVASENEIEVNVSLAIHLYRHFQLKKVNFCILNSLSL